MGAAERVQRERGLVDGGGSRCRVSVQVQDGGQVDRQAARQKGTRIGSLRFEASVRLRFLNRHQGSKWIDN